MARLRNSTVLTINGVSKLLNIAAISVSILKEITLRNNFFLKFFVFFVRSHTSETIPVNLRLINAGNTVSE